MTTEAKTSELTQEIAGILRSRAARLQAKQVEMADVAGVSQSHLSKMLRGKASIDVDQLDRLCGFLGLEVVEVMREADENTAARPRAESVAEARRAAVGRMVVTRSDAVPTKQEATQRFSGQVEEDIRVALDADRVKRRRRSG